MLTHCVLKVGVDLKLQTKDTLQVFTNIPIIIINVKVPSPYYVEESGEKEEMCKFMPL